MNNSNFGEHEWKPTEDEKSGEVRRACVKCGELEPTEEDKLKGLIRFEKCPGFRPPTHALFENPLLTEED